MKRILILKLRYLAELALALLFTFALLFVTNDKLATVAGGSVAFFIVGERHMRLMERPPWLGVLAFSGIGAVVLLLMPPKK
jgi:hypothetical protein